MIFSFDDREVGSNGRKLRRANAGLHVNFDLHQAIEVEAKKRMREYLRLTSC
jgi:hypothetical protein